jgi:hypothetical protein
MYAEPFYPAGFSPSLSDDELRGAAEARAGLSIADIAIKFESFGNDCEFGFFQRKCGAEPLGLFRFSNPEHDVIFQEVDSNFKNFGRHSFVELDQQQPRREWIIVDPVNRLREHTFIWDGDQEEEQVRSQQLKRIAFLRRMMTDNIRDANKIFVIKSGNGKLAVGHTLAIAQALRRRGASWLLWVEPGNQVGSVEVLADGLLRGIIDRLTVQPDAPKFSFSGWLAVTTEALLTVRRETTHQT